MPPHDQEHLPTYLPPHWVLWTTQTIGILSVTLEKVHKGLMGLRHIVTILLCHTKGSPSENLAVE